MSSQGDFKPAKVLIVDDHQELLQFLELTLTRRGWEVITSRNGREALDKLSYTSPNVILLDMWMPGMDGFELTQYLKTSPAYRDIPIVAVTGLASHESRKLCLDAGCNDYITKPFSLKDLEDHMMRLLFRDRSGHGNLNA